jgi:hypothetical protein
MTVFYARLRRPHAHPEQEHGAPAIPGFSP